jgi:hypothetical protein
MPIMYGVQVQVGGLFMLPAQSDKTKGILVTAMKWPKTII